MNLYGIVFLVVVVVGKEHKILIFYNYSADLKSFLENLIQKKNKNKVDDALFCN